MIENRYKLANPNNLFKDMNIGIIKDNTCMLKLSDVVELLNKKEEENKQLKKRVKQLEQELDAFEPVVYQDTEKGTIMLYARDY